jgi:hypothetical protein
VDQKSDSEKCLIYYQICPSCKKYNIFGKFMPKEDRIANGYGGPLFEENPQNQEKVFMIYPRNKGHKPLSEYIPADYRKEIEEAYDVIADSAKASAALSRRLLQRFLRDVIRVKPGDLIEEIQQVLDSKKLPSYLEEEIDTVRNIGNFATHPTKAKYTGEIVDVEPGEAEGILSVLEGLCDFYFVSPAKSKKRKEELNNKLKKFGKPPLKQ